MHNNYDKIADFYDVLSKMVFFRSQVKAQIHQLHHLQVDTKILIVGGGTGWILEEITKVHASGLTITYVEVSTKMLDLSKKRNTGSNKIEFINAPIEEIVITDSYDTIITAFLFDNFKEEKVNDIFEQLDAGLNHAGLWLFTDFFYTEKSGRRWQLYLLKMMYFFFNKIADVEAKALVHTERYFIKKRYQILQEQYYYGKFIKSSVYQKP